jgi:catechol-2,3-dioxygenase
MSSARAKLASVVMFIAELERSVTFYTELLALHVTIKNDSAALLVGPDGSQLYLRAVGDKATHPLASIGPQYVIWTAASEADFAACATYLRSKSEHVTCTDEGGFQLLESRDPDDIPVIVTFPGPDEFAREQIIARIYDS